MNIFQRISLTWRMFKILPKMPYIDSVLPKVESLRWAIPKIEKLEEFIPKFESLSVLLENLEEMQKKMPDIETIGRLSSRLSTLDEAINRIESLHSPVVGTHVVEIPKEKITEPITKAEERHGWERLKMLSKFVHLEGKAKEIELEWQRIRQSANNAEFAAQFDYKLNSDAAYKVGIAEGIEWCIKHFC